MSLTTEELAMVGGSDAAAIAGVHPHKRPIDVWRRVVEGHTVEQNAAMRRGVLLEPVIRQMWQEETGFQLLGPRKLRHPMHGFMRASLDDVAIAAGEERVVEYKSVNARVANRYGIGQDEVPEEHICQVQFYLALSQWDVGYLVALLGGDELRTYTLLADHDLQGMLLDEVERFWRDYVATKTPPPVDGSEGFAQYIRGRYGSDKGAVIQADDRLEELALNFRQASMNLDEAETIKQKLRQQLELAIGDAAGLEGRFGKISFKKSKDGTRVDWEAIVRELGVPDTLIQKHTSIKPGPRVFKPTWSKR